MRRGIALSVLVLCATAGDSRAQCCQPTTTKRGFHLFNRTSSATGSATGILKKLNAPVVPSLPGMTTVSPIGLVAPRFSNALAIPSEGGLSTEAGRLKAIGLVSPRISPVVGLWQNPPTSRQHWVMYAVGILAPRASVLLTMIQAPGGLRGSLSKSLSQFGVPGIPEIPGLNIPGITGDLNIPGVSGVAVPETAGTFVIDGTGTIIPGASGVVIPSSPVVRGCSVAPVVESAPIVPNSTIIPSPMPMPAVPSM